MADLPEEILAQKEHIEITLENLKDAEMRSDKSVIELSAIATFIHNFYNGIEIEQYFNTNPAPDEPCH